jgi:enediyne polyketide synthase
LLKTLITFGSIIARTGLPGEADYGLANQWLGLMVKDFQEKYPHCRCLNLEWSVWSGIGMGERLGRVDTLRQQGITPISPEQGIVALHSLLNQSLPSTSIVIAGRFGEPVTLKWKQPELPFLRFLEQTRVYYPGIELIVDAELSLDNDPYLQDHVYQGEYIFPGVMGLEAIAQITSTLLPSRGGQIIFESVKFNRPIVVLADQPLKIQIAALVTESGKIKAVIRSEQTGFTVDHFEAIFMKSEVVFQNLIPSYPPLEKGEIDPQKHLYGELLFHQGRFQRIQGYSHLKATECVAEIKTDRVTPWFSRYLPQELILGDPGARDAVIHALQACVPHATILPTGIERLTVYQVNSSAYQFVRAKERQHIGDTFIYDLEVFDSEGNLLETWEGLELRVIKHKDPQETWISALLPPYLERQIKEVIPNADLTIVIDQDATVARRVRSDRSLQILTSVPLGASLAPLHRRTDGKPELSNGEAVSVSHTGDLTLVVMGSPGCDVEPVVSREVEIWRDLLGVRHFNLAQVIKQETEEDFNVSATRVWCAQESLKKAGLSIDIPLTLMNYPSLSPTKSLWLESGKMAIATFVVSVREFEHPLVFAVLVQREESVKSDIISALKLFLRTSRDTSF